jgi:DNA-binding transcriptional LysR family regulator
MRSEPELRHLRTFVAVAQELHFTRAADNLHIAQQALSAQIRHLERLLGAKLFIRTTRKVELTDAGRTLLAHAEPLLAAADRAWKEVALAEVGELGQVTVSYSPTARREVLPKLLAEIHARYPRLTVRTIETFRGKDGVSDKMVDVAIRRAVNESDTDVRVLPLRSSRLGAVLASSHPHAGGGGVALDRLAGLPLTITPRAFSVGFYDLVVGSLRGRGWSGPVEEFENMGSDFLMGNPAALARIASGAAFGVGFEGQYPTLASGLCWLPVEPTLRVPLTISWRQAARPAVHAVVKLALELAKTEGWLAQPEVKRE